MTHPSTAAPAHVLVSGLHTLGLQTVELLRSAGLSVTVIDDQPDPRLAHQLARLNVPLVTEPAGDASVLLAAGLADAVALVAVEENDLANLEVVLLAHELRPDLRCVLRLINPALAEQVRTVSDQITVVNPAELAAPAFLTALMCEDRDSATVAGIHYEVTPGHPARLTPAARPRSSTGPDRARLHQTRARIRTWLGALAADVDRPFKVALGCVAVLIAVSTAVIAVAFSDKQVPTDAGTRPFGVLDALYFTVTTMATVGYGDYSFASSGIPLKLFGIFLIVVGAGAVSLLYAFATNFLVGRRLGDILGRSGNVHLRDHVLVVGLGSVGLACVEQLLAAGHRVVVVERDEHNRHLETLRALGVPVVLGDASVPATLARAAVTDISALAVLTTSDEVNLEVALTVRQLYAAANDGAHLRAVLRLFDQMLATRVETAFGLHRARSVSALAAPHLAGAVVGLPVKGTFYRTGEPWLAWSDASVPAGQLAAAPLRDLGAHLETRTAGSSA